MRLSKLLFFSLTSLLALPATPQNAAFNIAASAPTAVPPLIPYSGVVNAAAGQAAPANASVTFMIYNDETGDEPLFSETQSVAVDSIGRFKAQIGATLTNGIPIDLFASGEARWLAVQIAGEPPQPRVLLASVPYAMKAADADTLGGLPASAFALAGTKSFAPAALTANVTPNAGAAISTTTGGFSGYIPVFTSPTTIANSTIYQNANGIGINGVAYAALDVSGRTIFRGTMVVSRNGNATSTSGVGSVPLQFFANVWNSTINGPVQPVMQLQAEPTGNNTASPGATLNLLYSNGVTNAAETGFYFNANGTIHFAPGQTFPAGPPETGSITGVTAGTALTGGGTKGNVTLSVDTTKVPLLAASNTFTGAANTFTHPITFAAGQTFPGGTGTGTITGVTAGTALTGGGTTGKVTLNLDTAKVPLLAASNTFTGNQTITGNLSASGTASAGSMNAATFFEIGGLPFAYGSFANGNVYFGFAGNGSTTSGAGNTASGAHALVSDTTGQYNTASGISALFSNNAGSYDTASGANALYSNTTGNFNTASGENSLYSNTTGSENTASGYQALYSNTTGNFNTTGDGNTASGYQALYSNTTGSENTASGYQALYSNKTGFENTASGQKSLYGNTTGYFNTASGYGALSTNTTGSYNVGIGLGAGETSDESDGTGSYNTAVGSGALFGSGSISNATAIGSNTVVTESNTMILGCTAGVNSCSAAVSVGIGTTTPDNLLTVNGSADKPGGGSWGTYSDGRLKTVNGSFSSGLGQVMQLRPIRYRYKPDNGMGIRDMDEHIGVVAQEVQRVIPEAVTENTKGYLLVNNDPIIWSMVNAIKEQQREIEEQQKLLRTQSSAIEEQRAINGEQEKMLRAQNAAMKSLAAEVRETRKTLREVKAQVAAGQTVMVASK